MVTIMMVTDGLPNSHAKEELPIFRYNEDDPRHEARN
jgi:hypothetical protein